LLSIDSMQITRGTDAAAIGLECELVKNIHF
jgi:hypothetical protein